MANQEEQSEVDYREVLEHLRAKVRQFGFHKADEVLGYEIENIELPLQSLKTYTEGLLHYLRIFSDDSIESTKEVFRAALDDRAAPQLVVVLGDDEAERQSARNINLEDYRKCWELHNVLEQISHDLGPNEPQKSRKPGMGR